MTAAAGPAELEAARLLLARMGICPADLVGAGWPAAPRFAEYIPIVRYRRLDEPTASEIKQLAEAVERTAVSAAIREVGAAPPSV